jgi:GT2 family glycosyltransferase
MEMQKVGRNQICPCGSGKRFKDCCGQLATPDTARDSTVDATPWVTLMNRALAAQLANRLDEAEDLFRSSLKIQPDSPDALHMLGVIRYEKRDYYEARSLILRALELTGWSIPSFRHNLGLVLSRTLTGDANENVRERRRQYREWQSARQVSRSDDHPFVSVVIPCYNHERYVRTALQSVYEQTYRNIEIIVIDDGSTDSSRKIVEGVLSNCPFRHRFVTRENRGAPATINEGIAMSTGEFVNILNSDDWFHFGRIARMVQGIALAGADWGFSAVDFVDENDRPVDTLHHATAYQQTCGSANIPFGDTVGFSFLASNVAISSGNLFASRALIDKLGGFRQYRYNHDWDFCLRALWLSEPVFVDEALYSYRVHPGNTIKESRERARVEANEIMGEFLLPASTSGSGAAPFAPSIDNWGTNFLVAALCQGHGSRIGIEALRMALAIDSEVEAR